MIPFTYLCPWLLSSAFVFGYLHCQVTYFTICYRYAPSVEKREGFFFPPKHSTEKFFRKFFQIYPRRLFADFLARICDEGNGCLPFAIGGGYPFFVGLWACRWLCFASFPFPLLLRLCRRLRLFSLLRSPYPCGLPFLIGWQHRGGSGLWEHRDSPE